MCIFASFLLGAVTSGPAPFINVLQAGLHMVQGGAYFEAAINSVFRTGLETTGCEASLA